MGHVGARLGLNKVGWSVVDVGDDIGLLADCKGNPESTGLSV